MDSEKLIVTIFASILSGLMLSSVVGHDIDETVENVVSSAALSLTPVPTVATMSSATYGWGCYLLTINKAQELARKELLEPNIDYGLNAVIQANRECFSTAAQMSGIDIN